MTNKGGRPLKFATVEELQEKIDAYFKDCLSRDIPKPFTITGLALWLDTTRDTLMDYQNRDEFSDAVKKAKLRVENCYEEHLYANNVTGSIFALKNFGWTDKSEQTTNNTTIMKVDVSNKPDAEINERISELLNKTGEGRTSGDVGRKETAPSKE